MRIIYYYQTFCGLKALEGVTHLHLASIHFGYQDKQPYIHLNDTNPFDPSLDHVWDDCREAAEDGISVRLMIGGAGGAFAALFSNYAVFYPLLHRLLSQRKWLDGVDLDIEEVVAMDAVIKLVNDLDRDFPRLKLTFAPLASSLATNEAGMGGFSYKDLVANLSKPIDYFNVQAYASTSDLLPLVKKMVRNGYDPSLLVLGSLAPLSEDDEALFVKQIHRLSKKYDSFGGAYIWEYFNAPADWAEKIDSLVNGVDEE